MVVGVGWRIDVVWASSLSKYWRGQRKALQQLLWGMSPEGSMGTALVQALRQPLTHHVQKYVLHLLSLRDTIGEVSGRGQVPLTSLRPVGRLSSGGTGPWLRTPAGLRDPGLRRTWPGFGDVALF